MLEYKNLLLFNILLKKIIDVKNDSPQNNFKKKVFVHPLKIYIFLLFCYLCSSVFAQQKHVQQ